MKANETNFLEAKSLTLSFTLQGNQTLRSACQNSNLCEITTSLLKYKVSNLTVTISNRQMVLQIYTSVSCYRPQCDMMQLANFFSFRKFVISDLENNRYLQIIRFSNDVLLFQISSHLCSLGKSQIQNGFLHDFEQFFKY